MGNCWLCITTTENYLVTLQTGIWGVDDRYRRHIERIEKNDRVVFYIKGRKLGGVFRVKSDFYLDQEKLFSGGLFPNRIRLEPISLPRDDVRWDDEMIQKIGALKYKDQRWRMGLMGRSILHISKAELDYLLSRLLS